MLSFELADITVRVKVDPCARVFRKFRGAHRSGGARVPGGRGGGRTGQGKGFRRQVFYLYGALPADIDPIRFKISGEL